MRILIFLFVFISSLGFAQNKAKVDSLSKIYKNSLSDTMRAKALSGIAVEYRHAKPDTAVVIIEKAIQLIKNSPNAILKTRINQIKGEFLYWQNKYDESTLMLKACIAFYKKNNLKKDLAGAYASMSPLYRVSGQLDKAVGIMLEALKIYEEINDLNGQAYSYGSLSQLYRYKSDLKKSIEYAKKELSIHESLKSDKGIGHSLTDLGILYLDIKDYANAEKCLKRSIEYKKKLGDILGVGINKSNLTEVFHSLGKFDEAIENLNEALVIFEDANSDYWIGIVKINLAATYLEIKNYAMALDFCNEALSIAKRIKFIELELEALKNKGVMLYGLKNYKEAYDSYESYTKLKDSVFNESTTKQIEEANAKFETEKKDKAIQQKNSQLKLHELNDEKNATIKIFLYTGIGVLLIFVWFVFTRLRITSRQKKVIEEQKIIVDEKNKEVSDSINYAKHIQNAIMPPVEYIQKYIPNLFILYKPKAIVAGDFYWFEQLDEHKCIIAVADCTGHGVPGAMVSVVCSNALNRSVNEFKLTDTGKILDKTRELVLQTFSKSLENVNDGMDISMCAIIRESNSQQYTVQWSGANIPLLYIKNGVLTEIKANKQPIGKTDQPVPFSTHALSLNSGDSLYLFSDGFADQFGGPDGKKLKTSGLKQLIQEVNSKNASAQKEAMIMAFDSWKGDLEQIDDVCVVGIRL